MYPDAVELPLGFNFHPSRALRREDKGELGPPLGREEVGVRCGAPSLQAAPGGHFSASLAEERGVWFLLILLPDAFVDLSWVSVLIRTCEAAATHSSGLQKERAPKANVGFGRNP